MQLIDLPEGWIEGKLGELVRVCSGVGFPKKFQGKSTGDYPVYKVGDVSKAVSANNGYLNTAGHFVDSKEAVELKGEIFPIGTTLFAKIGEAVKLNRRAFILKPGLADNNVMAVLPDMKESNRFIYCFMRTVDLGDVSRSTTVPSVRKGDIEELVLAIPPFVEQKVIADKLDTLLAQVDNTKARLQRIPEILKNFRQSILAAAMSGKLTEEWREKKPPLEAISLAEIDSYWASRYLNAGKKRARLDLFQPVSLNQTPEKWLNTSIGYVFDVYVGATPSRSVEDYWNGDVPWVSSSEVAFCRINSTKESITKLGLSKTSTSIHPPGTVMLAMIGQGKTRGQAAILDIEACHNQNTAALRVPEGFVISEYLYFYLTKQYEETRGIGGGNNQQALNKGFVQSLEFPLPPLHEQQEIVRRVEELFAFADRIEQQAITGLARVNNLTQSILVKAFRGELTADWRIANPELIKGDNSAVALLQKIHAGRETPSNKKQTKKKIAAREKA
ncbi:restriction endonuclease subunit S [Halomonas sp. IOP_14]|uniref:restriction endonuclease subunit S n=1 Tax=Halomonas sp. IOP_14 TaxID=2873295 RepID=UPI001E55074D|nr:restriction endonuclease subunit S [Halomonas sp. IOP_14]MCD1587669.1 restriction endonuclease subunit S [Halomonas sp. IOP_14]